MGQLKPGATYVYERANGVIYARELGANPNERFEIGRDHNLLGMPMPEVAKIVDIVQAAKSNPALQDALDRVIIIYELSKQPQTVAHHPV